VEVAVFRLAHLSNFDELLPLERTPGVVVRFVSAPEELAGADLVVLPGTKSTVADLDFLRARGLERALLARAARGGPVLGICGGCQMLGRQIHDPDGVESAARGAEGLGLLPVDTHFAGEKRTAQVTALAERETFLAPLGEVVKGYEIHMGRLVHADPAGGVFSVQRGGAPSAEGRDRDGAVSEDGTVVGTMLHGLLESAGVRAHLVNGLRARKGLPPLHLAGADDPDDLDRLAGVLRESFRMDLLGRILG